VHAAQQLQRRVHRQHLGRHGYAAQAHARGQRAAGHHALAQPEVLRPQPDAVAKGGGVLQGALQHLGVDDRQLGLPKADAAGLAELHHISERLALEAARERPERKHPRLAQLLRPRLEHVHQAGFVEHRVGVGRADQAGDAASQRRPQLGLQHAGVLLPRLAQAQAQVH